MIIKAGLTDGTPSAPSTPLATRPPPERAISLAHSDGLPSTILCVHDPARGPVTPVTPVPPVAGGASSRFVIMTSVSSEQHASHDHERAGPRGRQPGRVRAR